MSPQVVVPCPRGHRIVRHEVVTCDAGHEHLIFVCPLRRGTAACGETVIRPMYGPSCWKDDGRAERD